VRISAQPTGAPRHFGSLEKPASVSSELTVLTRASSGTADRRLASGFQLPRHGYIESARPRALLDMKQRP
jgi:hypothetical protein